MSTSTICRVLAAAGITLAAACASTEPAPPPPPAPVVTDSVAPPVLRTQRELVLLGTTDVHNRLYPWDYYTQQELPYGLARIKPLVDSVRTANAGRTYLFDSGDLLQGNPLGLLYARQHATQPSPVIRAMKIGRASCRERMKRYGGAREKIKKMKE